MDEAPNGQNDKPENKGIPAGNKGDGASENNDQNKNGNVLASDDSIPDNSGSEMKINKYLIIAVIVIIVLLAIAYVLYHYNILGVRLFVRHTLGLSTPSSANSGLTTLISSNFPGINSVSLSSSVASKEGLNSTYFENYALFGTGNAETAMKNGSSPIGLNGMLVLLGVLKTNENLSYYYKTLSGSTSVYNITINGMPAVEAIENTTPPTNSSLLDSYGSFNMSGYRCNSSGFEVLLKNKLNETIKITNASIYSIANMTPSNSTVFNASINAIKPNETFNLRFPREQCSSIAYENDFTVGTNYSISSLSGFTGLVKFSPYLVKVNQSEVITVLGVENSSLYEISALSTGNNYVNELNSGFKNFIASLSLKDFTQ